MKKCATGLVRTATYPVGELLEAGASPTITNKAGLRPIDTVVGAQAESPLGQALLDMLTTQQAVAQLDTNDIAYGTLHDLPDDDDIADGDSA